MTHWARELLTKVLEENLNPPFKKPIKDLTNEELIAEFRYWNSKIENATSWGAGIAAANEFRKECEQQLHLRSLDPISVLYSDLKE